MIFGPISVQLLAVLTSQIWVYIVAQVKFLE